MTKRKIESGAEAALRDKLLKFAQQPRFRNDFDRGLKLYFGKAFQNRTLTIDEIEMPGFMEWFINDYIKGLLLLLIILIVFLLREQTDLQMLVQT